MNLPPPQMPKKWSPLQPLWDLLNNLRLDLGLYACKVCGRWGGRHDYPLHTDKFNEIMGKIKPNDNTNHLGKWT